MPLIGLKRYWDNFSVYRILTVIIFMTKVFMIKRLAIVVVLVVALAESSYCQSFYAIRRDRNLIVIAGTGTSTYFGELSNPGDYLDTKLNLNFGLQYYLSNLISTRAEITWFQLQGDDAKADDLGRTRRNLSFVSNNYEVNITGVVSLFPKGNRFYQRPKFNVYGFVGIGFLYFNPKAEKDGKKYALAPLQTEGVSYSRFQPIVPYGIGVKVKAGPFMNFCLEGGYRMTFTDYLDDVSTVHPDKTGWDQDRIDLSDRRPEIGLPASAVGAKRGSPDTNDGYFLLNVKVEYYLPSQFTLGNSSKRVYRAKRKSGRRR
jgi:hypothetical protein